MPVSYTQQTLDLPKELNDIRLCIVELVADIKAKKDLTVIVAETVPNLIRAVEGFDALDAETKDAAALNVGALLLTDLAKLFLPKPVTTTTPAA